MTDSVIEVVRGWISTGLLAGILLAVKSGVPPVLQYLKETRDQKLKERADERGGWGDLIDALRKEVARITAKDAQCEKDMAAMRAEIDGLRRMFIAQGAVQAVPMSPTVQAAAERTAIAVASAAEREANKS